MHPLIATISTHPAVVSAAQAAFKDIKPTLERLVRRPSGALTLGAAGGAATLTACFAAGVAVGWFTAPRTGAQLRAATQDSLRTWAKWATSLVRHDEDSPVNGSVTDLESSEVLAGTEVPAEVPSGQQKQTDPGAHRSVN